VSLYPDQRIQSGARWRGARRHFSATTLWNFRLAALGTEAVLWTILGLGFAVLAERRFASEQRSGVQMARGLQC